ncbi:MAG TPA: bifunctional riboflavin kinase/FMN adenylyltransferase [Candidatus Limnocylindrales bacterium]|nr:bifunctional riboflavin kinase/FMN adenylyltransferase [Candidatus Limnocylindrales bacterium]
MTLPARPIAMTIGVFDGLHRGHQRVISATVDAARERSGIAWVTTFDPHPDTIVRGSPPRPWITPPDEREELLHALGVDRVHVERFDRSVQSLPPEGFLDRVLGEGAPLAVLIVGPDFHMGKDRVGDRAYLEALGKRRGFEVREAPFLHEAGGGKLSSTYIRKLIEAGSIEEAASMLGRPYALRGRIGSGAGRGAKLGFPTANLEVRPEKLLPAPGIYISSNQLQGDTRRGLTYVGSSATFGAGPVRVEVHLMDYEAAAPSLKGSWLVTSLVRRLRGDQTFDSPEALVEAMNRDRAMAVEHWSSEAKAAGGR